MPWSRIQPRSTRSSRCRAVDKVGAVSVESSAPVWETRWRSQTTLRRLTALAGLAVFGGIGRLSRRAIRLVDTAS